MNIKPKTYNTSLIIRLEKTLLEDFKECIKPSTASEKIRAFIIETLEIKKLGKPKYKAYVDGCCHGGNFDYVGYASIIEKNGEIIKELTGKVPVKDVITYNAKSGKDTNTKNVSGEIHGVVATINYCLLNNIKNITICYDYEGLEKWALDEWETKTDLTARYKALFKAVKGHIEICFCKVDGKKGKNKIADTLAKKAAIDGEELEVWPEIEMDIITPKRKKIPEFIPDLENENTMAQDPVTQKQFKYLRKLKCKEIPHNKYEASLLIEKYIKLNNK